MRSDRRCNWAIDICSRSASPATVVISGSSRAACAARLLPSIGASIAGDCPERRAGSDQKPPPCHQGWPASASPPSSGRTLRRFDQRCVVEPIGPVVGGLVDKHAPADRQKAYAGDPRMHRRKWPSKFVGPAKCIGGASTNSPPTNPRPAYRRGNENGRSPIQGSSSREPAVHPDCRSR